MSDFLAFSKDLKPYCKENYYDMKFPKKIDLDLFKPEKFTEMNWTKGIIKILFLPDIFKIHPFI
ncbi:MAG: hypothetical protein WCH21_05535, partial [Bacteroidota bacterium]